MDKREIGETDYRIAELCGYVLDIPDRLGTTDDWCMEVFGKEVADLTDSELDIAIVLAKRRGGRK